MKDVLDQTWNIVNPVGIPVKADIDTGGGNAVNAAQITERLMQMGVAGVNIEDQVFAKRCGHMDGKQAIAAEDLELDEAIRRSNLYLRAGADMVFLDGIRTRHDIQRALAEIDGLLPDGVTSVETQLIPVPRIGSRRISSRLCTTRRAVCWKARPDGSAPSPSTRHSPVSRNIEGSRTSIFPKFRSNGSME